jgi:hypothetical protein
MAPGDTARLYHELTSYSPEREWTAPVRDHRVLQDFVPNDFERWPAPCKAYPPGLPVVELPRDRPAATAPATARTRSAGARTRDGLAAAIPGARLVVQPGTGHRPHWELPMRVRGWPYGTLRRAAAGGAVAMTWRLGWGLKHMSTDTFCSTRSSGAPARRRRVVDLSGPPAARRCDDLKPC